MYLINKIFNIHGYCPISFKRIGHLIKTPCNHKFEHNELIRWLNKCQELNNPHTCPSCMSNISEFARKFSLKQPKQLNFKSYTEALASLSTIPNGEIVVVEGCTVQKYWNGFCTPGTPIILLNYESSELGYDSD